MTGFGDPAQPPGASGGPDEAALESAVRDAFAHGRLGAHYVPVVDLGTRETIAHEALAEILGPDGALIPARRAFRALRRDPGFLAEVELALKRIQLAHAPGDTVFLKADPTSLVGGAGELLALLSGARVDVVVEVSEGSEAHDSGVSRLAVARLREAGIPFALDELGAPDGIVSFEMLAYADFMKFERHVLHRHDPRQLAVVHALIEMARRTGARTIMSGIESVHDLDVARDLGIGLVQGPYLAG